MWGSSHVLVGLVVGRADCWSGAQCVVSAELADRGRVTVVEEQRPPVSRAAMGVICSSVSSKSKTSMFSAMR